MKIKVGVYEAEEGGYWAEVPAIPGCATRGQTFEEEPGMDGDDGVEFMQAFAERFAADRTSFPHDKYFGPEAGATPLSMVKGTIRRLTKGS